jgi:tetratricopeptide (TPR) repeat protein
MRKINPIFLAGLLAVTALLGGLAYVVHGYQVVHNAKVLLDRARKAEQEGNRSKAAEALSRYLTLEKDDAQTWAWYARVVDELAADGSARARQRVLMVYEEALRHNPDDSQLERRCADLALEFRPERTVEARQHLKNLTERAHLRMEEGDSGARLELAELEELLGKCDVLESKFEDAAVKFGSAIEHDFTRLSCYDQRARLWRGELRKAPEEAEKEIERMVLNNPKLGRAYLYSYRYKSAFPPKASAAELKKANESAANDLKKAMELAADDPEVLLIAAAAAEQKGDPVAAQAFLEKGLKADPKNLDSKGRQVVLDAVVLNLARLEVAQRHPERAETVLREAFESKPSVEVALTLADVLILEGKIEGKGQAADYIAFLRERGQGDTLIRFLEARIEVQKRNWAAAISKIKAAQAVLKSDAQISTNLNLMLADCYSHLHYEEQHLAALRQAVEGAGAPEEARLELAARLSQSGQLGDLEDALAILILLADRRPDLSLDIARLSIRKTLRQPSNQRNWREAERWMQAAEKVPGQPAEPLDLLRAELLEAQEKWGDARALLTLAQSKQPRNLNYRLALARLASKEGQSSLALQILDQAEKDLGPSPEIMLARVGLLVQRGGSEAKQAIARLAETRKQLPAADVPRFLDQLAVAEIALGEPALARKYWREMVSLQPENQKVLLSLFDLAVEANDSTDARELVARIRQVEGEDGVTWRFTDAARLIDQARRGDTKRLEAASTLASEVADRRPNWWGAPLLNAQIAELRDDLDKAVSSLLRAVELGNQRPVVVRHLVGLLYQRNQFDEIGRITELLRSRGVVLEDLTIVNAINAIRRRDFNQGIALARQVVPANSSNFADHLFLGRVYFAADQLDEAGVEFKRAVEVGRGTPEPWLTYIDYLVQTERMTEAKAAVEEARKSLPADKSSSTLARCAMIVGDTRQAEALIQAALEAKPNDPGTLRLAAAFALGQGRTDRVGTLLDKLIDPATSASPADLAWANRTRSTLLLATGGRKEVNQALELVDRNLKNKPNSQEDLRLKANLLGLRFGRRADAIKILEPLSAANLLPPNDQFLLAQLYLSERQDDRYKGEMLRLLDRKLKAPEHLAHYTRYLISHNQLDQAGRQMAELKKRDPKGLVTLEAEAALLKARNRDQELLTLLEARGQQAPDQIGEVARLLDRYGFAKEAEAAYKAFVARAPDQPERILALASFLARRDRSAEATEICKRAWSTCPPERVAATALSIWNNPSTDAAQKSLVGAWLLEALKKSPKAAAPLRSDLATIYLQEGRYDEAESLFREILSSDPEDLKALNNLAWILALRDSSKTDEALELINRAIEIRGPVPSLVDTRAVVLIRGGQLDQAVQELRNAQALEPKNPSLALHMAWAYQSGDKTEEARQAFERAEKLGWKPEHSDPVERTFADKLRRDLAGKP